MALARFEIHCHKWQKCSACPLHEFSSTKVLYRGTLPCEVLIIGEAPGITEHGSKIPFPPLSPHGAVLEQLIKSTIMPRTYCVANIVACTPFENENLSTTRVPKGQEIDACSSRVIDLIKFAAPSYIIACGKTVAKALRKLDISFIEIQHPTRIANQGEKGLVDLHRANLIIKEALQ